MMECKDPKPFYSIGVSSVSVTVPAETTENTVDGAQSEPVEQTVAANKVDGAHVSEPIDNVPTAQQVVLENGISGIKTSFKSEVVMESVDHAAELNETCMSSANTISTINAAEKSIINDNDNDNVTIGQNETEPTLEEPQIDFKSSIRIAAKERSQISESEHEPESVPALTVISAPETPETPQVPEKRSELMKIIKSEVTFDETVTAKIDDRLISATTRGIKREHQPDENTAAEATVPIIEKTHPVSEITAPIVEKTQPVTETSVSVVTSTVPLTKTTAPIAESTVPVTETTNLVSKKSPSKSPKQKSPPKQKEKIPEVNNDVVVATTKAKVSPSNAKVVSPKASVAPVNVTSNGKRIRFKTQLYQAPLPEEDALLSKLSNSVHVKDDRVIVFKKSEFIAVRSPENSFFICRSLNNINKKSKKCRIQWLAKNDKDKGDVYINDFYDVVDFETILTNVQMSRVKKNQYSLPLKEKQRVQHILKKVLDVESGVAMPSTDNVDDGIDISQINNSTLDGSPDSRSTDNNESTVAKSRKRSAVPKTNKRSASVSIQEPNSKSVRRSNRTANTSIAPVPVDEEEYGEMVPTGSRKRTTTANKRSTTKNVATIPVSTSNSSTKSTKSTPKAVTVAVAVSAPKLNVRAAKKNITSPVMATSTTGTSKNKTVSVAVEKRVAAVIAESKKVVAKGRRTTKTDTNLPAANNKKNEPKPKAATTVADGKVTKKRRRRKRY